MQSRTEEFLAELRISDVKERCLRSFGLYEEYSKSVIADTIGKQREAFDKADANKKRELQVEVESEVKNFRIWLKEDKNLEPSSAHYHSASLKSLLLGLPMGVQIAQLFSMILDTQAWK